MKIGDIVKTCEVFVMHANRMLCTLTRQKESVKEFVKLHAFRWVIISTFLESLNHPLNSMVAYSIFKAGIP